MSQANNEMKYEKNSVKLKKEKVIILDDLNQSFTKYMTKGTAFHKRENVNMAIVALCEIEHGVI